MNDTEAIMALAFEYRHAIDDRGTKYRALRTAIDDLLAELDDARSEATALRVNEQNLTERLGQTTDAYSLLLERTYAQPAAEPAQREWIGLTDEDLRDLFTQDRAFDRLEKFSRIIEAKLREKNGSKP